MSLFDELLYYEPYRNAKACWLLCREPAHYSRRSAVGMPGTPSALQEPPHGQRSYHLLTTPNELSQNALLATLSSLCDLLGLQENKQHSVSILFFKQSGISKNECLVYQQSF